MEKLISFFKELEDNNEKPWFDANKKRWLEIKAEYDVFAQRLIDGLAVLDPQTKGVTVKDCTYRIYRDVRFSPNKLPYKTHIGIYVCPKGKKSGHSGYYFHIEPFTDTYFIYAGLHLPQPEVIKSVREEVMLNGKGVDDAFQACVRAGYEIHTEGMLRKVPRGWNPDDPYSFYYRMKDFGVVKNLTEKDVLSENLVENLLSEFAVTVPLNNLLNRAFDYAYENLV